MILITLTAFVLAAIAQDSRCLLNPSTHVLQFGNVTATIISDGPGIFPENPFLISDAAVERSYKFAFRTPSPLIWSQNIVILDMPDKRVLVDAGSINIPEFPFFDQGGLLIPRMKATGISPESIDVILLTHGHPDHVSGITSADGDALFPNAKVYIGEQEHNFWTSPESIPEQVVSDEIVATASKVYLRSIAPYRSRLQTVSKNGSPMEGIKYLAAFGHTPGHSVILVSSGSKTLLITADTWATTADQLQNPEWGFALDFNGNEAVKSRLRILSLAAKRGYLVSSYHESFPGLGYVTADGPWFKWQAAPASMLGTVSLKCGV